MMLVAGGYDGLGAIREKELVASCISLGLQQRHVTVLNDAELQDGTAAEWPPAAVAQHVQAYVQQHAVQAVSVHFAACARLEAQHHPVFFARRY